MLDEKTRSLVAVGASITANCQPCLDYHATQARAHGAHEQEISVAIEIGQQVRRGAAGKMDRFASQLLGDEALAVVSDCGCK